MNFDQEQYFSCPYCAGPNSFIVDLTAGQQQKFICDCEVCCAPIVIHLKLDGEDIVYFDVEQENN